MANTTSSIQNFVWVLTGWVLRLVPVLYPTLPS